MRRGVQTNREWGKRGGICRVPFGRSCCLICHVSPLSLLGKTSLVSWSFYVKVCNISYQEPMIWALIIMFYLITIISYSKFCFSSQGFVSKKWISLSPSPSLVLRAPRGSLITEKLSLIKSDSCSLSLRTDCPSPTAERGSEMKEELSDRPLSLLHAVIQ